jgi:hypothetical protein
LVRKRWCRHGRAPPARPHRPAVALGFCLLRHLHPICGPRSSGHSGGGPARTGAMRFVFLGPLLAVDLVMPLRTDSPPAVAVVGWANLTTTTATTRDGSGGMGFGVSRIALVSFVVSCQSHSIPQAVSLLWPVSPYHVHGSPGTVATLPCLEYLGAYVGFQVSIS